jgi:hypothetical protein
MMPRDRGDAIVVRYDPVRGPERKDVYEPQADDGYDRREYVWTGCAWRYVGGETVENATVSVSQATVGEVQVRDAAAGETHTEVCGP